jgi:hypothetical protein
LDSLAETAKRSLWQDILLVSYASSPLESSAIGLNPNLK